MNRMVCSMNYVSAIILSLFIIVGGTAAQGAGKNLIIKGSTTVLPIAQTVSEVFMDRNPEINISVQGGGSGVGIASLLDGTTDIADSSRKIQAKELARAKDMGIQPYETIIALDGIALIVHPLNILNYLTREQVKAIYTGKISNWSQLGGEDKKIVVISRDTSSGTFEAFELLVLDKEKVRPDALTTASNQAVVMTVASSPNTIGYAGLSYVTKKVKALKIDKVECTSETILSGEYPLSRPLYMYTNGAPEGLTKQLIDFVLSAEGQKLVEEEGFEGVKTPSIRNSIPDNQ